MKLLRTFMIAVALTGLLAALSCGPSTPPEDKVEKAEPEAEAPPQEPAEAESARVEPEAKKEEPKPAEKPSAKAPKAAPGMPVVVMETSMGAIRIELNAERAPVTVKNFLEYVDAKFYDGTIFHRVMPNFMIQGGGFTPDMTEKETRPPIKNESANGLANVRGAIAMARTPDPHSASSQFFINHITNSGLNRDQSPDGWGYAVFGKVIEGMDVVDKIAAVKTTTKRGHANVPVEPVIIKSVRRAS